MSFLNKITPEQLDLTGQSKGPKSNPLDMGKESRLAYHPQNPVQADDPVNEEAIGKSANLVTLIATTGLRIQAVERDFHKYDRDGSSMHGVGHVVVPGVLSASMLHIKRLEAELELAGGKGDPTSRFIQIALDQAHGLDAAIRSIKIEQLKAVLGDPELPEAQLDPEWGQNGLLEYPGNPGVDELTVG